MVTYKEREDDNATGEIYEPCNDNLQHHRRMDVDSDFYVVGLIADRASAPPARYGKRRRWDSLEIPISSAGVAILY